MGFSRLRIMNRWILLVVLGGLSSCKEPKQHRVLQPILAHKEPEVGFYVDSDSMLESQPRFRSIELGFCDGPLPLFVDMDGYYMKKWSPNYSEYAASYSPFELRLRTGKGSATGFVFKRLSWPFFNQADAEKYRSEGDTSAIQAFFSGIKACKEVPVRVNEVRLVNVTPVSQSLHFNWSWLCFLLQEAQDESGVWRPIEHLVPQLPEFCGTASVSNRRILQLPPGAALTVAVPAYKGAFRTKIRVRAQIDGYTFFSNEIDGTINKGQFDTGFLKAYLKDRSMIDDSEHLRWYFLKD